MFHSFPITLRAHRAPSFCYSGGMQRYAVVEKAVGETPLAALERFRSEHPEFITGTTEDFWMQVPLLEALRRRSRMFLYGDEPNAPKQRQMRQKYPPMPPLCYAGRLDPMASGKLLILIGDECKRQQAYHKLDKEYVFEVLFGVGSDTGDVLGRLEYGNVVPEVSAVDLRRVARSLSGSTLSLPYPAFSAKTVAGKPLHVWTLEGRLDEIEIPTATTRIHRLTLEHVTRRNGADIAHHSLVKIEAIPPVTEASKRLGADFRRVDVRRDWQTFREKHGDREFIIATFACTASAGTYMRSLAEHIGARFGTSALAYSIHRTTIGRYMPLPLNLGLWLKIY